MQKQKTLKTVLIFVLVIASALLGLLVYKSKKSTPSTPPGTNTVQYHGGPCDDPVYYQANINSCAVQ